MLGIGGVGERAGIRRIRRVMWDLGEGVGFRLTAARKHCRLHGGAPGVALRGSCLAVVEKGGVEHSPDPGCACLIDRQAQGIEKVTYLTQVYTIIHYSTMNA